MIRNYLKITLRNLRRHPVYSVINVAGLAIGVACCLLILQFVRHEWQFDRFHENADRIYRIVSDWGDFSVPATNPPFVKRLETAYPEIEQSWMFPYSGLVNYEMQRFREDQILFANEAFYEVFSFDVIRGAAMPDRPFTVVITPETARKYFGEADPIGKVLEVDNQFDVEVTGLIEAAPSTSHFSFSMVASWATLDAVGAMNYDGDWGSNGVYTYLLFPDGFDPETLTEALPAFIEQHAGDAWNGADLELQALTDIHLHSHLNSELAPNGNQSYLYIFSAIAFFILLIACINFMNLATARAAERAREVGVRKVVGADRRQLIGQFLIETFLLSLFAIVLAIWLAKLMLPLFVSLTGREIAFNLFADAAVPLILIVLSVFVGVLAGSYPAFILSAFRPVSVLKGAYKNTASGAMLRKGLVVFQFATSIVLIVGTGVIFNQLTYLREAGLGFDKEQVLQIDLQDRSQYADYRPFKDALLQNPRIEAVSIASERLPSELLNGSGVRWEGTPDELESYAPLRTVAVGHDFFEALGVEMLAGRPFREEMPTDSMAFVVNEAAWKMLAANAPEPMDSPEASVGRQVIFWGGRSGPLLGIVNDFNMASLHEAIEPIIFYIRPEWFDTYHLRVAPQDFSGTLRFVEETWQLFYPEWPLQYQFADESFDARYRVEERLGQLFSLFALLALFVGCLGLFGLASFTAVQRTKEIGVRKVLGASVADVVVLLSRDFTRLVLIALVVAIPIAWFAMHRWLEGFAYHVNVNGWLFPAAGILALLIAWLSVSYQSIQAALTDPVKSLRYE